MLRDIDLKAVSDGRLYRQSDMAKVGCNDCKGCSDCCRGMGSSIVLDPYDCFMLCKNLGESFESLLSYAIELQVVDGIILPNLKMADKTDACAFLNEQGRCGIHSFQGLGFAGCFPLEESTKTRAFNIFCRFMNVPWNLKAK